jgi:uncharacterized membrane protein
MASRDTNRTESAAGRPGEQTEAQPSSRPYEERLARGLGWFSLALGTAQTAVPDRMTRLVGLNGKGGIRLMRIMGLREIGHGLLILARRRPAAFVGLRVAGDLLDLELLRRGLAARRAKRRRIVAAMAAVGGATLLDAFTAEELRRRSSSRSTEEPSPLLAGVQEGTVSKRPTMVRESLTVNRPVSEVYSYWRDFSRLPTFMNYLESVTVVSPTRSHWKTTGLAGKSLEWDAEIVEEQPGELISWRSLEGADVSNAGVVRFLSAPGDRGTEIHLEMLYDPPGGSAGAGVAKLFGRSAEQQVHEDLRRFKQVIETGEIVLSEAVVGGRRIRQRPGQAEAS